MQVQIVEALRAAIVVVDQDRIIRTTNPAADEILGVTAPRRRSRSIDETSLCAAMPPRSGRRWPRLQRAARRPRSKVNGSLAFTEHLVDVLVTPFGDEAVEGGVRGVLVVADDVSDAVATKSRLIQTERLAAIGRMAAHVTHEVRNPLSSIGLNVDMLGDEVRDCRSREHSTSSSRSKQELERSGEYHGGIPAARAIA